MDRPGENVGRAGPRRLDAAAVAERLTRLDAQVAGLESAPGPVGEQALDALATLTEIYGEALARVVDHAAAAPAVADALAADELLTHLLTVHEVHPEPVERRIGRALDRLGPTLRASGGDARLLELDGTVARVRLTTGGCAATARALWRAVEEAVLAAEPGLSRVERVDETGAEKGVERGYPEPAAGAAVAAESTAGAAAGRRPRPPAFVPAEALLRGLSGPSGGGR